MKQRKGGNARDVREIRTIVERWAKDVRVNLETPQDTARAATRGIGTVWLRVTAGARRNQAASALKSAQLR